MSVKLILEPGRIAAMTATPEGVRDLAARALGYPKLLRRRWNRFKKATAASALTVDDMRSYFSFLQSLADVFLHTARTARGALESAAEPAELSALDAAAASLKSLRAEIADTWAWLDAPPAARPIRTTEEIRAGVARGEYVEADEAYRDAIRNLPETR